MESSFLPAQNQTSSPAQIVASSPAPNLAPSQTKIPVTSDVDRRLRWHIAAWWVMFILLLVSWFALGALVLSRTDAVRNDARQDANLLGTRITEGTASAQTRIDSRTASIDSRVDQIMRDNAMLRSELSALEMRVAQQESTCRAGCSVDK